MGNELENKIKEQTIQSLELLIKNLEYPMYMVHQLDDKSIKRECGSLFADIISRIDFELIPLIRKSEDVASSDQ